MTDLDYLREACRYAAASSHDPNTQNGAVLVTGKRLVYAANSYPPGLRRTPERAAAPAKYLFVEHAERAVIYAAAAAGVPTAGSTLYCPWFACTDCARAIILAGVREVVGLAVMRNATPARWLGNVETAERMLEEAGVAQRLLTDKIGAALLFDGREFSC